MRNSRLSFPWRLAIILWGVSAVGVWAWTTRYEFKAQAQDEHARAEQWPANTSLALAEDRPTLLFFVHPRCPCTRASARELERTLTGTGLSEQQQPNLIVVASAPPDASAEWRATDTLRRTSTLPRSEVFWDVGGVETSRFGMNTSGAVMLFDAKGDLQFAGGVTSSRGHEGDNIGGETLHALLSQQVKSPQASTPVFGCKLCVEPNSRACDEKSCATPSKPGRSTEGATP